MICPLFPRLSRFCDVLSTASGGYPFPAMTETSCTFYIDAEYTRKHKQTLCLTSFLLLSCGFNGLNSNSGMEAFSVCLLTGLATFLSVGLHVSRFPREYLAAQKQLFRYFDQGSLLNNRSAFYHTLQLIEAGLTILILLYIPLVSLYPFLFPESPAHFYSFVVRLFPGNLFLLRIFRGICFSLNAIIWIRIFVAVATWGRYAAIHEFSVMLITFNCACSLPGIPTKCCFQQFRRFGVMFAIVCDLYGFYLLPFALIMTPGLVRTYYYFLRYPEFITVSTGVILGCQAVAATFSGLVLFSIAGCLHAKSKKAIQKWKRSIPLNERKITWLFLLSCRPPLFHCLEAGLKVKCNSAGLFLIAVCSGTFCSVLTLGV